MIVNVGLPGWFVAIGLRVMVKQPGSPGIPGFFVAIFSVAAQLAVRPIDWYNCRMEFFRKDRSLAEGHPGNLGLQEQF